jgi:hypothetical protein
VANQERDLIVASLSLREQSGLTHALLAADQDDAGARIACGFNSRI